MDERLARRILDKTKIVPENPSSRLTGLVTDADPLTVTVRGTARTDLIHLDSYSPRVNDHVWIDRIADGPLVLLGALTDVDETVVAANAAGNWSATQPIIARIVSGRVWIDGVVSRSSGTNTTICTLPSGYRPPYATGFSVETFGARGAISIATSGVVSYGAGTAATMYLDGTSFRL